MSRRVEDTVLQCAALAVLTSVGTWILTGAPVYSVLVAIVAALVILGLRLARIAYQGWQRQTPNADLVEQEGWLELARKQDDVLDEIYQAWSETEAVRQRQLNLAARRAMEDDEWAEKHRRKAAELAAEREREVRHREQRRQDDIRQAKYSLERRSVELHAALGIEEPTIRLASYQALKASVEEVAEWERHRTLRAPITLKSAYGHEQVVQVPVPLDEVIVLMNGCGDVVGTYPSPEAERGLPDSVRTRSEILDGQL